MTAQTRTWQDAFVVEPLALAKSQPAQVAISSISVSLTAEFFAAGGAVNPIVAYVGAIGVEYAYLKGLADAAFAGDERGLSWKDGLTYTAAGLLVIAGTYVLLTRLYHVQALINPPEWGAVILALLHVTPLALIGLCSAQLHAAAERHERQQTEQRRLETEARAKALQAEEDERKRKWQERMAEIEAEKRAALARVAAWEEEQAARLRASAQRAAQRGGGQQASAASGTVPNTSREHLIEQIARTLSEHPKANRAELARSLGIGRTTLYGLISEAQARGLLPRD
jgi:hypothetical protein